MYDPQTLEILNAKYVAEERRRIAEEAKRSQPAGLIEGLIEKVMAPVPSLHHLLAMVKISNNIEEFRVLVHEFLPEKELEIMAEELDEDKAQLFYRYFGKKYFPLDDEMYGEYPLESFIYAIPVRPRGLREEDYHNFTDTHRINALLSYLVEYPYHYNKAAGPGHREALYDFILKNELASRPDLDNVPKNGWTADEIGRALEGTHYHGMIAFTNWLTKSTGTWVLDCDEEDEMDPAPWNRDNVEYITEMHKIAAAVGEAITILQKWMEQDTAGNFGRLVDAIRGKVKRRRPRVRQKTLFEVFKEKRPETAKALENKLSIEV